MVVVLWHAWLELTRRPCFRANTLALNLTLHEIYLGSTVVTIEHASDFLQMSGFRESILMWYGMKPSVLKQAMKKLFLHIAQQSTSVAPALLYIQYIYICIVFPMIYLDMKPSQIIWLLNWVICQNEIDIVLFIFFLFVFVPNTNL